MVFIRFWQLTPWSAKLNTIIQKLALSCQEC
jgi:hypothetical protein